MAAIGRAAKGGLGDGGGSEPGTAPSSQISGIATLWSASVHVVALPVLLAVVGFWIICRLRLAVDSPKRRHPAYIEHLAGSAAGKKLNSDGNKKLNSECSNISAFATMTTSNGDPKADPVLPGSQEDMFFTWDSGGSGDEYSPDSFVHTAVELPKYPDGSITEEERQMLLMYVQNNGPTPLVSHNGLGSASTVGTNPSAGHRSSCEMSSDKIGFALDPQGTTSRGYLETIVEENSDDLRSPSECDDGSLGWGSWDESSELESGSDDDRITVVEVKTSTSAPPSKPSISTCLARARIESVTSNDGSDEDSGEDRSKTPLYTQYVVNKQVSDDESLSSSSLASFVDDAFNCLWESHESVKTDSNSCDSKECVSGTNCAEERCNEECPTPSNKSGAASETITSTKIDNMSSCKEEDTNQAASSDSLIVPTELDENWEANGSNRPIRLIPSKVTTCDSKDITKDLRCFLADERYVDSAFNDNLKDLKNIPSNFTSKSYDSLLSIETAPTYLPDNPISEKNPKIRCFRIGFGTDFEADKACTVTTGVAENSNEICKVKNDEKTASCESNDQYEILFSPRQGDVSFGSVRFDGHSMKEQEISNEERQISRPDINTTKNASVLQATMPFPTLTSGPDSEGEISTSSGKVATYSLSRWQHHTDLQKIDLEEVAGSVARWRHQTENQIANLTTENIERFANGMVGKSANEKLTEEELENSPHWNLYKSFKNRNKMSRIRLSDAKNNNFKALGLWENETKVTLPPFGLVECNQNNEVENHNENLGHREEDLDDLELDMFAVSSESNKNESEKVSLGKQHHFFESKDPGVQCCFPLSNDKDKSEMIDCRYENSSPAQNLCHDYCLPNIDQHLKMNTDQFVKTESYGKTFRLLNECDSTTEFKREVTELQNHSSLSVYNTNLCSHFPHNTEFSSVKERHDTVFEINSFQNHDLLLTSEFYHANFSDELQQSLSSEHISFGLNLGHVENGVRSSEEATCDPEYVKSHSGDLNRSLETRIQKCLSSCTSLDDSDDGIELCSKKDKKEEVQSIITDVNCDMKHDDSGYVEDDDEDEEEDILEEQNAASKIAENLPNGKENSSQEFIGNAHDPKMVETVRDKLRDCGDTAKDETFFNYNDFSEELHDNSDAKAFSSLTCGSKPSEFSSWLLDREVEKVSSRDMVDKLMENELASSKNSSVCEFEEKNLNAAKDVFDLSYSFSLDPEVFSGHESLPVSDNNPFCEIKSPANSPSQRDSQYTVIKSEIGNNLSDINSSRCFRLSEEIIEVRKSNSENMTFECSLENYAEFGEKSGDTYSMRQVAPTANLESSYQMHSEVEDNLTDSSKITTATDIVNNETKTANTGTGEPSADTETPSLNPEVTSSSNNKAWGVEIFDNNNEWATERNLLLGSPHQPFHDPGIVQLSDFVVRGLSLNETAESLPALDNEYLQDNENAIQCDTSFSSLQMGTGILNDADVFEKPHVDTDNNSSAGIVAPSVGLGCNLLHKQIGDDVAAAPLPFDPVTQGKRSGVGEITCFGEGSQDDSSYSLATTQPDATGVITFAGDDVTLRANTTQHVSNDAGFAAVPAPMKQTPEGVGKSNSWEVGSVVGGSVLSAGEGVCEKTVPSGDVELKSDSNLHKTATYTNVETGDDLILSAYRKISRSVEYRRSKSLVREGKGESSESEDFSSLIFNHHSKSTPDLRRCNDILLTSSIPLSALLSKSVSQRIQEYLGESSRGSKLRRTLPQTERSRHYRRICSSTETVVEKAARFEARHRSSSQESRPLAVTTGIPRNYSSVQQRSGSCPPLMDTFTRNKDNCTMLPPSSFNKSQHLLPRCLKNSPATQKPTATVRPTTERSREHMLKSNGISCELFETDNIHDFDNCNQSSFAMKNKIGYEPDNRPEDLFERITGYSKASVSQQPLAEKPPLPPSSNIRGRIASARKDFFERLSQQEANIKKTIQSYEREGPSLDRFERFRKSAREERARLAASHPDLGALEAEVRSSRRRIDHHRKNTIPSKSDSVHNDAENTQEGGDPSSGVVTSNTTASKERTRICTPYRRCTGEIAWASCAKRLEQERLKSRSQGYLETDVDSHLQRTSPAGAPSGPLQPAEDSLRAQSLLSLGEDDPHPEPAAICEELHCNARARSMDFLLDADNREAALPPENRLGSGQGRVKSEHELRIERSLQNLTIPDWYKQSPWSKKPKEGFILRRGSEGSAGESRKRWQGFGSSRTPSASSLTSSSYSHRNVVTPKRMTSTSDWRYTGSLMSSRESLPPASPASLSPRDCTAFQYGLTSLSRWSSSRLSTNSAPLSAWSVHRSFRQPYLGWRAATASSAQTPSSGGSRSSPGMSPAASTPIYGSRPVSPRRPSTHDHQSRDSSTLRPDAGDTSETNRISPLALYDNANGVFFSNAAELMVPKSFTEDVSSKVKIHAGMYDEKFKSGQWPEIRRDRYSYTQSLCNSATLFSPPGIEDENQGHQNPLDTVMREDRWARSIPPRVWMESSFVGTKKNTVDSSMTSSIKPGVISESKDQADDKSSTSFARSPAPSSSFRSSCAPPRQMGEYVLRDFRRFGITL